MDNRGADCQTEDLILFRRIFEECLRACLTTSARPSTRHVSANNCWIARQRANVIRPNFELSRQLAAKRRAALDSVRGP